MKWTKTSNFLCNVMLTSGSFIDLLKNTHKEIFNFNCGLFLMLHIAVIYKNYEFLYCLKIVYYIFAL